MYYAHEVLWTSQDQAYIRTGHERQCSKNVHPKMHLEMMVNIFALILITYRISANTEEKNLRKLQPT
jgi:hypothetical protein